LILKKKYGFEKTQNMILKKIVALQFSFEAVGARATTFFVQVQSSRLFSAQRGRAGWQFQKKIHGRLPREARVFVACR
jgi:hypothetical protein